jgi:hypothetical protein
MESGEEEITEETKIESEEGKKRRSGKLKVVLGRRDVELLAFVAEQRFALLEQLSQRFFGQDGTPREPSLAFSGRVQSPHKAAYRRAWKMVKAGYLLPRHVPMDRAQIYQVGKLGLDVLVDQTGFEWPYLADVDIKNFRHDSAITELRLLLEPRAIKWSSERLMRLHLSAAGKSGHVPDAVFTVQHKEKPVRIAIEMELSLKSLDRYPKIIDQYRKLIGTTLQVDRVLYICGQGVRESLRTREDVIACKYLFAFLDWAEVAEKGLSATVRWPASGERHTLGDLV